MAHWTTTDIDTFIANAEQDGVEIIAVEYSGTEFRPTMLITFTGDQSKLERLINDIDKNYYQLV